MRTGTPSFVAERLKQSRQVRQLTMTDLANKVGVSTQAISAFEKGDKTPHRKTFQRICEVLSFPESFFLMLPKVETRAVGPIFFRSMSAATKRARVGALSKLIWLQEIHAYLSRFVKFPPLCLPSFEIPRDPVALTASRIEDLAIKLRRHWNLGDGPISDLVLLLENNGCVLARSRLGTPKLDAVSTIPRHRNTVYVLLGSEKTSSVRSRFDAAHEAAHAILHQGLSQAAIQRSADFRLIEGQAHRFAAALLFPRSSFLSEVAFPSLDTFLGLKKRWRVSIKMMIVRARRLEMLSEQEYRNMAIAYNRRGWNRAEPLEDQLPLEQPRLLRRAVELLTEKGTFSIEQLRLGLSFGDAVLTDLLALPRSYFAAKKNLVDFPTMAVQDSSPSDSDNDSRVISFPKA